MNPLKSIYRQCRALIGLLFLSSASVLAQTIDAPTPGSQAYQMAKAEGILATGFQTLESQKSADSKSFAQLSISSAFRSSGGCYIPNDPETWFGFLPNDDGSLFLELPFTFNLFGEEWNSVYINNNGNLTFGEPLSAFSAEGFPIDIPMVAPFWADVDTRGDSSGFVTYFITPTALIVSWPGVGYYNEKDDLISTFQVVITDGNDSLVNGNVAFFYQDMQWTTGDASMGVDGFDGVSSTVGANRGDGANFFQLGRFNQPDDEFLGPNFEGSGIDYLDFECFEFDISSGINNPPLLQDLSSLPTEICTGDTVTIDFSFTDPELLQTLTAELNDTDSSGSSFSFDTEANTLTGVIVLETSLAGSFDLELVISDDGNPQLATFVDIEYTVSPCEPDCEGVINGAALPGTICETNGGFGFWSEECLCEIGSVPCAIEILSTLELTDACVNSQPIIELTLDVFNPNVETEAFVLVNYAPDTIATGQDTIAVPADGGVFFEGLVLETYGVNVNFEIFIGEGDSACSVLSDTLDLPIPECIPDCQGVFGGSALPGTPCDADGENGIWNEGCQCVPLTPSGCLDFRYFLADNPGGSANSKIYEVSLDDDNNSAQLTEILSLPYGIQIGYDDSENLLYIVRSSDGSFRTLDVSVENGFLSEEIALSQTLSGAAAVGFTPGGSFFIGSGQDSALYVVNKLTGGVSFFREAPVNGGDLAFRNDGNLYLATRDFGGVVFELTSGGEVSVVQNVPQNVTGMAITEFENGLVSIRDRSRLYLGDDQGNPLGEYLMFLNGSVFTAGNGDLASGCGDGTSGLPVAALAKADSAGELKVRPNPTRSKTVITFKSFDNERVVVELLDVRGILVDVLLDRVCETADWQQAEFDAGALPAGIYIVRMVSASTTKTARVLVGR